MSDRRLVIAECDATSADKGKLFALDPGKAAGIGLPAFDTGNGLPPAGTVIGQGFYDKLHRRGFVWDGTAWKDIAPSPIIAFATQAALVADTTNAVGTYATAGDTGNLFVKQTAGWRMIGVVQYATATDLLADNPAKGTLGEAEDEDTLWERTATGWRLLVVREMADTTAILAWANGSPGATVGDRAIDLAHEVSYIRTTGGWKPTMIWEETEANIRLATWAVNGQEAIATDTGRTFIRTGGAWVEEPIQHFATDALLKAATPADGTLAWADDTAAVYARAAGKWIGMNTGFSDPLPIGAISAFPTHTMPAGYLLCDGSTIPAGTDYDELRRILGGTTTPDLRGQFLRGSSTATDALLAKIGWTTARPHQGFTGLTNEDGDHYHRSGTPVWDDPRAYINGRDVISAGKGAANWDTGNPTAEPRTNTAGAHFHTVSINGGGDTETAPDHVRICWGIKARHATVVPATALVVNTSAPKAGDVLTYDGATSTWENKPVGGFVVGSVQQSILTEAQWTTAMGADAANWVLADGRAVPGTKYATITGQANVPDLRGAFIRAAGTAATSGRTWAGGAVGTFGSDTTRRPRNADFTADSQGNHRHQLHFALDTVTPKGLEQNTTGMFHNRTGMASGAGTTMYAGDTNGTFINQAGAHTHSITGGGDTETAPVHVSMNTFIRVN